MPDPVAMVFDSAHLSDDLEVHGTIVAKQISAVNPPLLSGPTSSAVIESDANAVHLAVRDGLELKRGVRGMVTEQFVVATSKRLNLCRERLEALPKPLRCGVLQGSRRGPLR